MEELLPDAGKYGVTLCAKAHVNAAIWNPPTTLKLLEAVTSPNFGLDMDPSHIYRANENPVDAISAVISRRYSPLAIPPSAWQNAVKSRHHWA